MRVSEDFPDRVRKVRSLLIKFLDQAIKSGKEAYLRYDKLVVNGYSFEYDCVKERPVPVVKKGTSQYLHRKNVTQDCFNISDH